MAPSLLELFGSADHGPLPSKSSDAAQRRRPPRPPLKLGAPLKQGLSWQCHEKYDRNCAQSRWQRMGARWQSLYGTFTQRLGPDAKTRRITWLTEAPCRQGKKWGIGCAVCADLQRRLLNSPHKAPRKARAWSTKWSRHEICGVSQMQACAILQHSRTEQHKVAMSATYGRSNQSPSGSLEMTHQQPLKESCSRARCHKFGIGYWHGVASRAHAHGRPQRRSRAQLSSPPVHMAARARLCGA